MRPSQARRAPDVRATLAEGPRDRIGAKNVSVDVDNANVCAAMDTLIDLVTPNVVSGKCAFGRRARGCCALLSVAATRRASLVFKGCFDDWI